MKLSICEIRNFGWVMLKSGSAALYSDLVIWNIEVPKSSWEQLHKQIQCGNPLFPFHMLSSNCAAG